MSTTTLTAGQTGFFTTGKIDVGFEIKDGYVYGVCLLYPSRADQEHEYMIREKSIVAIGERDLSACVEDAKDFAYKSAISRLERAGNPIAAEQPAVQAAPVPGVVQTDKEKAEAPAPKEEPQGETPAGTVVPVVEQPAYNPPAPTSQDPDDDELDTDDVPSEEDGDATGDINDFKDEDDGESQQPNGIQRLDLNFGLQPASNLLSNAPAAGPSAPARDIDPDMKKALSMPITILGKLHASFGKTAGEILESDPQCIVDFAHRYTGPKVEEKEALVKLYPEAVRRVQNAA